MTRPSTPAFGGIPARIPELMDAPRLPVEMLLIVGRVAETFADRPENAGLSAYGRALMAARLEALGHAAHLLADLPEEFGRPTFTFAQLLRDQHDLWRAREQAAREQFTNSDVAGVLARRGIEAVLLEEIVGGPPAG